MLKNYLKTLLRTLRKNKLATVINIVGLTVAFCCATLLLLRTYHEFSFDNFYPDKERLFKVYSFEHAQDGDQLSASMPYPIEEVAKKDVGVDKASLVINGGRWVRYGGKQIDVFTQLVGKDFISMFSLPVEEGNRQTPLANQNEIVLTAKTAKKIFGNEEPVGKQLEVNISDRWVRLTISTVLKDLPNNSSIQFDALASYLLHPGYPDSKNAWNWNSCDLYVKLRAQEHVHDFEQRLQFMALRNGMFDTGHAKRMNYLKDKNGDYMGVRTLPVTELHFNNQVGTGDVVSEPFLYVLLLIAAVILLIACFNFINLNIGVSFTRTREIGVRKYLGALKRQIWLQVWGESFLVIALAGILGVGLAMVLIKKFNQVFAASVDVRLLLNPFLISMILLLIPLISLLASGYPSSLMARLKTTEVLKGKLGVSRHGFLRNGLIALQFVIAIILMCTTFIIYQQFQYLRKAPLGYNTKSLISIPIADAENGHAITAKMRSMLATQSAVESVSASSVNLGLGKDGSTSSWGFGFDFNGSVVNTNFLTADADIAKTLGIPVKEGRDFSDAYRSDTVNNVIITESMAKQLNLKQPLGQKILYDSSRAPWVVVGIIPDFQLYSMRNKRQPLTIGMNKGAAINYVLIRVRTQNPVATMELVKKAYREAEPGVEFTGSYVAENVDRWYRAEERLAKMFTIAAVVAIALSCMGLFGMAFIVVGQRTKEIGVRKVLGASIRSIATLVSKEFIKPVIIAIIIAIPIALWMLNKWLQHFTYRVSIAWWVFAAAGAVALVIAILTVSLQAIKAAVANPVNSLRDE